MDPEVEYTGAKFVARVLTDEEIEARYADDPDKADDMKAYADVLRQILDNDGTVNKEPNKTPTGSTSPSPTMILERKGTSPTWRSRPTTS